MNKLTILSLGAILTVTMLPASAMDAMNAMSAPSNSGMGGTMATCKAPDRPVIVNTTKMTYELDTKPNRSAMRGMMNHDKFICRSAAEKLGAKMRTTAMSTASHM